MRMQSSAVVFCFCAEVPADRWHHMRTLVGALPRSVAVFKSFGLSLYAFLPVGGRICYLSCAFRNDLGFVDEILPTRICDVCDVALTVTIVPACSGNHLRLFVRSLPCGVVMVQNSLRHPQKFLCADGITCTCW